MVLTEASAADLSIILSVYLGVLRNFETNLAVEKLEQFIVQASHFYPPDLPVALISRLS